MANMLDYVEWFGDVGLDQVPFNEVDNLLLAQLSYVALEGVVPTIAEGGTVTMAEAAQRYLRLMGKDRIYGTVGVVSPLTALLPQKLAGGRRFGQARLGRLHSRLNAGETEQLAVLHVQLSDGSTYVSFRGTDDTLVGWREDFHMTYETVQAQRDAATYLDVTCQDVTGPLMVGGHSKGGNLAVYGAACCSDAVREKIACVWNDDGPGFGPEVLSPEQLAPVLPRTRTYVPTFDVVGQLLGGLPPSKIVTSSQQGILQHDAMSWQVQGTHLVAAEPQELDPASRRVVAAFAQWLGSVSPEERQERFAELFGCLEAADVTGLSDLMSGDAQVLGRVWTQLARAKPEARGYLTQILVELAGNAMQTQADTWAQAAQQAVQDIASPRELADPRTPLSSEEMARWRRENARQVRWSRAAQLVGLPPATLKRVVRGAGVGAALGAVALWALNQGWIDD